MELTIDQALQKGIEAHKAGQVQEADRLYTAILKAHPKHPDANHNMGVLAVGVGKVQRALPFFKTALEANPSAAQFWFSCIDALIKLKRLGDAKAMFDQAKGNGAEGDGFDELEQRLIQTTKAESMTPQNSVLDAAVKLRESGNFNQAIDLLKDEITKVPHDSNIRALLSHCHILSEDIEEATIQLDKAKRLDPNNALVGWNEVRLLLKNNNVSDALAIARSTNKQFPDDVEGMGVLGSCLKANNDLAESLIYLNKAIELDPSYAEALINRGLIRLSKDDKASALADLEKAHKIKPHIKQIWDLVIGLKVEAKHYSKAISLLLNMIEIDPTNEKTSFNMALCYQKLADFAPAIEAYKRALAIKPDYAEAYINVGTIFQEQGKPEDAIETYNKALAINPDFSEAYYNMGISLKDQGKLQKAIDAYNKALSLKPDYAEAYSNMGNALKDQGKVEDAIKAYNKTLSLKPDLAEAITNLAILLFQGNSFEEAAELFSRDNSIKNQSYLLKCLYELDDQSKFYNKLDYLVERGENNCVIGSFTARAEIRYGIKKNNPFCNDPFKYVLKTDLTKECDFKKIFVENVANVLNNDDVKHKSQGHLTNGIQTAGNIFTQVGSVTDQWQNIIYTELNKYKERFCDSEEGFIKDWPSEYSIYGWLESMKSGGELSAHIHDEGWITGSIYINVPSKSQKYSGNLVVSIDDSKHGKGKTKNIKSIDVVTGSLCLFPSSLLHYTVPFEADEDRIVLAFDVIPK